ncbi:MAG: hypothetical protein DRJ51_05245 [Thermoprotei archaeon]|nr:MAG: hypothetical protein DRJ51_05245 [Thermoprotei archaeon]
MTRKAVRIVHIADTHIDLTARYLGPKEHDRRRDFLRTFNYVLEKTLELRPDIVLMSGDLYDKVNPRNPARAWIMRAFRKIHGEGIRAYIIGGNHDTPRSVEEGASPLHELEAAGYVKFFSKISSMDADIVEIQGFQVCISGASFNHTMPYENDPLEVMRIPREGDINIAMLHYNYGPARVPPIWMAPTIKETSVPKYLHYLALGHFHRHYSTRVGETYVVYPGSIERRSFAEEGESKGFVYIEVSEEGVRKLDFIETKPRPLKTVEITVVKDSTNPVSNIVTAAMKYADPEAILRLKIRGRLPLDRLVRYSRDEVLRRLENFFFYTIIDDRELEYILEKPELEDIEMLSPLKLYEKYLTRLIREVSEEGDEKRKVAFQDALQLGKEFLREVGAW